MARRACACGGQVLIVRGYPKPLDARPSPVGDVFVTWAGSQTARPLTADRPQPEWNEHRHTIHHCEHTDA